MEDRFGWQWLWIGFFMGLGVAGWKTLTPNLEDRNPASEAHPVVPVKSTSEYIRNSFLQFNRTKRFDHVRGNSGTLSFSDVRLLIFCSDHQEGQSPKLRRASYGSQQINAGHPGHVPVSDHQFERILFARGLNQTPRDLGIFGLKNVGKSQLVEHAADNAPHSGHIVDNQNFGIQIHHSVILAEKTVRRC